MYYAFVDWVARLGKYWWLLMLEFVFGVVGAWQSITPTIELPVWIWWLLLAVTFLVSNFLAFYSAHREYSHSPPQYPDITIKQLTERILGRQLGDSYPSKEELEVIGALLRQIRARAANGSVKIWGRKISSTLNPSSPKLAIEAKYWEECRIDVLEFLKDWLGKTSTTSRPNGSLPIYEDLALSKQQVIPVWLRPRYTVDWRWPIIRKVYDVRADAI